MHQLGIVVTLAAALAVAVAFGALTRRAGLSSLVGYLLAGIVVGPHTPGFIADQALATQMAEIGVILLMFGVGMHFHPRELLRVWRLALPGAVGQSAIATLAGWALARLFGWSHAAGIVFGLALSVASTVVLMRMLAERGRLSHRDGHVAVGWLIVEDLFTVAALVVLPVLAVPDANGAAIGIGIAEALLKVAGFAAIVALVGTRLVSRLLERAARTRSAELFTLSVFVVALGVAALAAELFHVSVALGAFFAGLVVGQSRFGPQAAADMAPFRDVFSALFFVSIGMLFDPAFVLRQPLVVLAVLTVVVVLKPIVAVAIVFGLRGNARTAATVGVGLAQIGEFSFILASLGVASQLLPQDAFDAIVVAAIVSIAVNPLLFGSTEKLLERRRGTVSWAGAAPEGATAPVVLTGYGPLGRRIASLCHDAGVAVTVIERDPDAARGRGCIFGDAGRPEVLMAAGLEQARVLVLGDGLTLADKLRICAAARQVNGRLDIVATAAGAAEAGWLVEFGAEGVHDVVDEPGARVTRDLLARL